MFYVNIPFGLVALIISILVLPPLKPAGRREPFDFAGGVALGVALLAFAIAMSFGQELGFAAPIVLGLLLVAIAAGVIFVVIEQRIKYPMVDLSLFREPRFSLNLFTAALIFVALSGVVLLLPFYLTYVMELPLGQVGLMMAVVPLVMIVVQPLSGALSDIWGSRQVSVLGLVLILFGYLLMSTLRVDGTELGFVVRMLPVSTGMAIFNSPNNSAIMGAAPRNRLGIASALLSMVRSVAQVFGIAALGAFFAGRVDMYSGAAVNLDVAPPQAIVQALHDQFILVSLLVAIGLAVSLFTWRWEVKAGRAQKRVEPVAGSAPVETLPFEG
ncbi:MAG: MFS transporter [Anaerolineales bacterium]|nr:MFS transporter [Anaerolineales bacterium]